MGKAKINKLIGKINPPEDIQGFSDDPNLVSERLQTMRRFMQDTTYPLTETQKRIMTDTKKNIQPVLDEVDKFFSGDWASYRSTVEGSSFSLFKR